MLILAIQDAAARRMWRTSSPTTDSTPPATPPTPPIYTPGLWRIEALEAARLLERGIINDYSYYMTRADMTWWGPQV
jgi:hypothetical protein